MRGSAEYVKQHFNKPLRVAEIGVREGINALEMLKGLNIEHLFLIDPFLPYQDTSQYREQEEQEDYYNKLIEVMTPYMNKITILRQDSTCAISFENNYFDYVYIDASHFEEDVYRDATLWYNKVNKSGVLAGHDYRAGHVGVESAIDKFVAERSLKLHDKDYDWYIIKREK